MSGGVLSCHPKKDWLKEKLVSFVLTRQIGMPGCISATRSS